MCICSYHFYFSNVCRNVFNTNISHGKVNESRDLDTKIYIEMKLPISSHPRNCIHANMNVFACIHVFTVSNFNSATNWAVLCRSLIFFVVLLYREQRHILWRHNEIECICWPTVNQIAPNAPDKPQLTCLIFCIPLVLYRNNWLPASRAPVLGICW